MSGRYLLDTNIIIALFGVETPVIQHLRKADEVFIPSVAMGELYYGAYRSHRKAENLAHIADFVAHTVVLNCDAETASNYGELKDRLRQQGRPIPENDLWIAALAIQHKLVLVSRDAHFAEIAGLDVESW
jgi:tRNA(fMet)-specific endonuclease VapC